MVSNPVCITRATSLSKHTILSTDQSCIRLPRTYIHAWCLPGPTCASCISSHAHPYSQSSIAPLHQTYSIDNIVNLYMGIQIGLGTKHYHVGDDE